MLLQPGKQISVDKASGGTSSATANRSGSGGWSGAGGASDSHISVEDDGASGVGAAAAAALSVALARSWTTAAQQVCFCNACGLNGCAPLPSMSKPHV